MSSVKVKLQWEFYVLYVKYKERELKEYIRADFEATTRKMSTKFNSAQKTIINYLYNFDYVNEKCQNVPRNLN